MQLCGAPQLQVCVAEARFAGSSAPAPGSQACFASIGLESPGLSNAPTQLCSADVVDTAGLLQWTSEKASFPLLEFLPRDDYNRTSQTAIASTLASFCLRISVFERRKEGRHCFGSNRRTQRTLGTFCITLRQLMSESPVDGWTPFDDLPCQLGELSLSETCPSSSSSSSSSSSLKVHLHLILTTVGQTNYIQKALQLAPTRLVADAYLGSFHQLMSLLLCGTTDAAHGARMENGCAVVMAMSSAFKSDLCRTCGATLTDKTLAGAFIGLALAVDDHQGHDGYRHLYSVMNTLLAVDVHATKDEAQLFRQESLSTRACTFLMEHVSIGNVYRKLLLNPLLPHLRNACSSPAKYDFRDTSSCSESALIRFRNLLTLVAEGILSSAESMPLPLRISCSLLDKAAKHHLQSKDGSAVTALIIQRLICPALCHPAMAYVSLETHEGSCRSNHHEVITTLQMSQGRWLLTSLAKAVLRMAMNEPFDSLREPALANLNDLLAELGPRCIQPFLENVILHNQGDGLPRSCEDLPESLPPGALLHIAKLHGGLSSLQDPRHEAVSAAVLSEFSGHVTGAVKDVAAASLSGEGTGSDDTLATATMTCISMLFSKTSSTARLTLLP